MPHCPSALPDTMRVAPRDLLTDLARLDERVLRQGHAAPNYGDYDAIAHELAGISRTINALIAEARDMPHLGDANIDCGYDGPAADELVQRHGLDAYTLHWTCPRCGAEHHEEHDRSDG